MKTVVSQRSHSTQAARHLAKLKRKLRRDNPPPRATKISALVQIFTADLLKKQVH